MNGLQRKTNKGMADKRRLSKPMAALESIMLTAMIDAHEGWDVMCTDIPNAFIQAEMPDISDGKERVTMKITGVLVDMLVQLSPEIYGPYVVFEKQWKVIYVQMLKVIYGMLQATLLWYNKSQQELEKEGFEFNPYDPCVGNQTKNGSQHMIQFHVDDVMSSHINPKVNDNLMNGYRPNMESTEKWRLTKERCTIISEWFLSMKTKAKWRSTCQAT